MGVVIMADRIGDMTPQELGIAMKCPCCLGDMWFNAGTRDHYCECFGCSIRWRPRSGYEWPKNKEIEMTSEELKNAIRDGLKEAIRDIKKQYEDDEHQKNVCVDEKLSTLIKLATALKAARDK
jgi:hypothetical protein